MMMREQTHMKKGEFDFLAGFKVEVFVLDDDAALCLVCFAHIERFKLPPRCMRRGSF
jgi:hypothetical protein